MRHLTERVNLIHKGQGKDILTIREGIAEQDDEGAKLNTKEGAKIPDNVKFLKEIQTTKTTVRKAKDYPVLRERFVK